MTRNMKLYVYGIIVLGIVFVVFTLGMGNSSDLAGIIFFTVLSIIAESLLITTTAQRGLSVGFAISLCVILLYGAPSAAWITGLGIMFRVFDKDGQKIHIGNTPIYKTLFNGANIVLSVGAASYCYKFFGGNNDLGSINHLLIPIAMTILVYIAVNATIMSILMKLITEDTFFNIWYKNIAWVIKDYFGIAPLGVIMAVAYKSYGIIGALLFFGPLLLARYSFKMYIDMKNMYYETVKSLCLAMEAKDPYTQGHSARVSEYAARLSQRMGLSKSQIENVKMAGILHDIGKIGVEEKILNKPEKLTDEEYAKIKLHPSIGYKIIHDIGFLSEASKIILSHHERFDGKGYPNGVKADNISKEASIISICDAFDAMTSDRPYRKAMTVEHAMNIIENDRGTFYDPNLVDAFRAMIEEDKEMIALVG